MAGMDNLPYQHGAQDALSQMAYPVNPMDSDRPVPGTQMPGMIQAVTPEGTDLTSSGAQWNIPHGGMFTKHPEVIFSETLLLQYQGQRENWAQNAQEDEDFRNGVQWTKSQERELKRMKQNPIVVNVIYPAVEQAKAALTSNSPRFQSTAREGSDMKVGAMFSDLMAYIWDISLGNVELKRCIDDYYVKGMGALMGYVDPFADRGKGEVMVKSLDPMWLFFDPNSVDVFARDSAHIIISRIMTLEHIWNVYPSLGNVVRDFGIQKLSNYERMPPQKGDALTYAQERHVDPFHKKYELIDRYTKVQVKQIHVFEPISGYEKEMDEKEFQAWLDEPAFLQVSHNAVPVFICVPRQVIQAQEYYQQTGGTFHYAFDPQDPNGTPQLVPGEEPQGGAEENGMQTIPGSTIILQPVTMKNLLEVKAFIVNEIYATRIKRTFSIGGILFYYDILPKLEEYPIVPMMNRHFRNPYPMSDVRFVRPLQEYVNKLRSLIIAHATNSTGVKLLIPRGSANRNELVEEWQKAGTGVIEYDAELGQATVAGPVPLPNELYQNERQARADIQEILGVYSLGQGDTAAAPNTYKGTIALDEFGQRRIKSKKDDVEACLNQLGKVVIALIQTTYTEPKVIRLLRPNNEPLSFTVNEPFYDDLSKQVKGILNDITVGRYDIVVVSGSTLPNNRWARFEYYLQLYKEGIIDAQEVLKQTEVVDAEAVMKRMDQIKALQQALQQAQMQIKGLKGDLQTASRESVHAQKRVEVEKFKSQMAEQSSKVAAASHLFSARLGDEISNAKRVVADRKRKTSKSK